MCDARWVGAFHGVQHYGPDREHTLHLRITRGADGLIVRTFVNGTEDPRHGPTRLAEGKIVV